MDLEALRQDWLTKGRAQNAIVDQHAAAQADLAAFAQQLQMRQERVAALADAFANAQAATAAAEAAFKTAALEGVAIQTI